VFPGKNPFCILAISPIVVLGGTVSKNGSAFVQAIQAKKYGRAALHAVGVMGAFIPPGMGGAVAGSSQPTLAMVTPGGAVFAGIAAESTSISAVHVAAAGILMSATGASGEWDGFLKLGQAELEARLKAQYGEEVWVFERIDPHFDLTRIPEGAYKYVVVEKEGFRQLRIGVGKATTEHHDLVLAGENVVGAGKLVYTRSSKGIRIVIRHALRSCRVLPEFRDTSLMSDGEEFPPILILRPTALQRSKATWRVFLPGTKQRSSKSPNNSPLPPLI